MAGFLPRLFANALPRARPFTEMGVSGTPVYAGYVVTAERNPRLIGQEKHRTFSDILANTSIVAAGVRYFLNVVARPSWSAEPADDSAEAKKYADFVNEVLFDELHTPWSRVVRRAGTYRFHGFQISEWTAIRRDDGKIGFDDIESRPQWTIWRWEVDDRGTVTGAWQRDPLTGRELGLPRGKLMYLVDDTLTDTPEGMGLLRHCVEPAERLKEYLSQEAIGFLRDLRGIPIGKAPMDELANAVKNKSITQAQMDQALDGLKDFVTLEKKTRKTSIIINSSPYVSKTDSGVMIANSPKWGMELIQGGTTGLGDVGKAIDRVNYELARIIGCEHLLLGSTSAGSFALSKEKATDLYLMANSVLTDIRLQAQHDLIWPLWALNGFPDNMMPKLKSEDVSPKDVEQIARVMRDMATAGAVIPPDDEAINFMRDLLGAPHLDLVKFAADQAKLVVNTKPGTAGKDAAAQDKQDAVDQKAKKFQTPVIAAIRKVLGGAVADYIHDFVHSNNSRFAGKSKEERIQMALGAYYGKKMVPYEEAEPYRAEDESITGQSGTANGHDKMDTTFDVKQNVPTAQKPSDRSLHSGRGELSPGVPGSNDDLKGRNGNAYAKYNDDGARTRAQPGLGTDETRVV